MTRYAVEYRSGSLVLVATFDSMLERALFIVAASNYIHVIRVYEVRA